MSKGQAQIFAEFLGFALGLVVMISIAFIFSSYLAPQLINEAMEYHLDNMLKQVETTVSQMIYYSEYFGSKTQTLKLDLPSKLNKQTYEIYEYSEKLCVSVSGTTFYKCVDNKYNIKGSFVSGTRLLITLLSQKDSRTIVISAD